MGLFEGLKVALVHDWLTDMRGGERVLEQCLQVLPQAELYTLLHVPGRVSRLIEARPIHTSFLQRLPGIARTYRYWLPLFPLAVESLRLRDVELVLSVSQGVAKAVRVPPGALHVCYLNTPLRYMWDGFDDYFGPGRARLPVRLAARLLRPALQHWDRATAGRVHRFVSNSRNVQERTQRIYGRASTVIYPPVSLERFGPGPAREEFYLMVGAFAPNKRVDQAVTAFNRLGLPLHIVGGGQTEALCRRLAGPTITFLGERSDEQIANLYRRARAFVFPGTDDFGITPVEAQASGTPVIAHASGGALETVTPETGVFYQEASAEGLAGAVRTFAADPGRFDPAACVANARRFGTERFRRELEEVLIRSLAAFRAGQRLDPGADGGPGARG